MLPISNRVRVYIGWTAVVLCTAIASFWAFWGAAETFHEGWYDRSLWRNLALTMAQYLAPLVVLMAPGLLALRWPKATLPLFLALAVAAGLFFGEGDGVSLIAVPLAILGILFALGRPEPKRWAYLISAACPIAVAIVTGAGPGYRAVTRFDDGNYGARLIRGNGVELVWAPAGPGWGDRHATWGEATQACLHLSPDGLTLSPTPVGVWRLPTVDEAVRSLVRKGNNAGGVWDPVKRQATYAVQPEKESPLWRRYSQVIYWWTATEDGPDRAFRVVFNGWVRSDLKRGWGDYWAYRCVSAPGAASMSRR